MVMQHKKFYAIGLISGCILLAGCQSEAKLNSTHQSVEATTIFETIKSGNIQAVQALIHSNIDLEQRNSQGETALMNAIYSKQWDIAKLLMQAGADVNAQDNMQNSPFLYAGAEGYLEIVKLSLNYQPDFNVYNRYGGTALIPAAEKGHVETVRLLANVPNYPINHVNKLGWTALVEAVVLSDGSAPYVEIIKILLEAGADKTIPDKNGVSALQHAEKKGYKEIAALLRN